MAALAIGAPTFFHNLFFVFTQAIKFVNQLIDLRIGRIDLPLNDRLAVISLGGAKLGLQF